MGRGFGRGQGIRVRSRRQINILRIAAVGDVGFLERLWFEFAIGGGAVLFAAALTVAFASVTAAARAFFRFSS